MIEETWNPTDLRPPTIDEVVKLARDYFALPGNSTGGSFHIVLEDGNLSNSNVAFCSGYASGSGDVAARTLGVALSLLSRKQRAQVYERYAEYAP